MVFKIFMKLGLSWGDLPASRSRDIEKLETWDLHQSIPYISEYMGKLCGVKINLGIFRNIRNLSWNRYLCQFPENGQLARPAPELLYRSTAKAKCSTSHFKHCGPAERPTRNQLQIRLENYKFHDFHDFHKIWSLTRRRLLMDAARYREATDMRLAPIDFLYFKVHRKIRPSQNKFRDFEKSGKLVMKKISMSVSRKWPTSPALHPNYSIGTPLKLKCSTSIFEHCAAAEHLTGNPL